MNSALESRLLILCLSVVVATVSVFSQDAAKKSPPEKAPAKPGCQRLRRNPRRSPLPTIKFEKYTLPNGLDVILSEDHRLPLVSTNIWYHVGPANEVPGPHRLRAPVRAHDVRRVEARCRHAPHSASSRPRAPPT